MQWILLGLDGRALLQEIFPGGQQFLIGHAQVVGQESDHAAGLHIGQFATKNQLLDHQGGGVASSQRQDLGEQVPNRG